jgi:hypothetical protein
MHMKLVPVIWLGGAVASTAAGGDGLLRRHIPPGHGGLEYRMRHGRGHFAIAGQLGMCFPTPPGLFSWALAPAPIPILPTGGLVAGVAGHMLVGHPAELVGHLSTHVAVSPNASVALASQILERPAPTVPGQNSHRITMNQVPPTPNPAHTYPLGMTGLGYRTTGLVGPGQPGPGQLPNP